jgi:hypothetical protein
MYAILYLSLLTDILVTVLSYSASSFHRMKFYHGNELKFTVNESPTLHGFLLLKYFSTEGNAPIQVIIHMYMEISQ